jgi:hypothetical protein
MTRTDRQVGVVLTLLCLFAWSLIYTARRLRATL